MALALRLTYAQFKAQYTGKYGMWRSKKMVSACDTMKAYDAGRPAASSGDLSRLEVAMVGAWAIWCTTDEFRKLDTRMNGTCTKLAVEMGAKPGIDRERNTSAFILTGTARIDPKVRKVPKVTLTKMSVPALMEKLSDEGRAGGVVLIDAFGNQKTAEREHGFTRTYGLQESTVMENIEVVLETAQDLKLKMFDVTMNVKKTWKSLTDKFPTDVTSIVKPRQGLFDDTGGAADYLSNTKAAFQGLDYVVAMGWDANQCVGAGIFGVERIDRTYAPGLVDLGLDVVTSRNLLAANQTNALESKWGWPYLGTGV